MKKLFKKLMLKRLRSFLVIRMRTKAGLSWSAINKILMALDLPQMNKTSVLNGKCKVYFNDGKHLIVDESLVQKPIKIKNLKK